MKILFVNPTRLDSNNRPIKFKLAHTKPLVFAILDRLTPPHHKVRIINDIAEEIDFSEEYDLVGITALTSQAPRAYQIADRFRKSGTKVIMGGIHASAVPEEAQQHADSIVIGEAENLWEQILSDFENNRYQEVYQESSFQPIERLIIPKWDNINPDLYVNIPGSKRQLYPFFTTRGCKYNCKYCSVTKFFGHTVRLKPIEHVLEEIDTVNSKEVFFLDDDIAVDTDYSRELFKQLIKREIHWYGQISMPALKDPSLIELAGKSGCVNLFIGTESINEESLKSVRKGFNKPEEYLEIFKTVEKNNIVPFANIIFGIDHDTPETIRMTADFLARAKVMTFFWLLTPYPGTDLRRDLEKEGRVIHSDWKVYDAAHAVFKPKNFTPSELQEQYEKIWHHYYSYPQILKRALHYQACWPPINPAVRQVRPIDRLENVLYSIFIQGMLRSSAKTGGPLPTGVNRRDHL